MTRVVAVDVRGAQTTQSMLTGVTGVKEALPTTKTQQARAQLILRPSLPPPSPPHCLVALRVPAFLPPSSHKPLPDDRC